MCYAFSIVYNVRVCFNATYTLLTVIYVTCCYLVSYPLEYGHFGFKFCAANC